MHLINKRNAIDMVLQLLLELEEVKAVVVDTKEYLSPVMYIQLYDAGKVA